MSTFKVGDFVAPVKYDKTIPAYEVKAIFEDEFGSVLLSEIDGYGYGSHYCKKVNVKKATT